MSLELTWSSPGNQMVLLHKCHRRGHLLDLKLTWNSPGSQIKWHGFKVAIGGGIVWTWSSPGTLQVVKWYGFKVAIGGDTV